MNGLLRLIIVHIIGVSIICVWVIYHIVKKKGFVSNYNRCRKGGYRCKDPRSCSTCIYCSYEDYTGMQGSSILL